MAHVFFSCPSPYVPRGGRSLHKGNRFPTCRSHYVRDKKGRDLEGSVAKWPSFCWALGVAGVGS